MDNGSAVIHRHLPFWATGQMTINGHVIRSNTRAVYSLSLAVTVPDIYPSYGVRSSHLAVPSGSLYATSAFSNNMGDIFGDKRTRSQLSLPDNIYQRLPLSRSPLKDAHEILLSPTKSAKRAASPSRDAEYSSNVATLSELPVFKRPRRDYGALRNGGSENINVPSSPDRHFTELNLDSPKRVGDGSPHKSSLTPRRACSVPPMFPSIDLRNPPSSPNKSRSPRKMVPMLKFTVVVPPRSRTLFWMKKLSRREIAVGEVAEPSQPAEDLHSLVANGHKTPTRTRLTLTPLSPLTPLPESPFAPPPPHRDLDGDIVRTSGLQFEKNNNVNDSTSVRPESLRTSPLPPETDVHQSRIPRPSIASENGVDALVPDPVVGTSAKSHAQVAPLKKSAFDIIMNAPQPITVKGKKKGKAASILSS
ncbi:hypothetical protein IW261DRAFT_1559447 [Armillaria novae-zelandiae]|uniref:Uncharacterized protein n=1 Tax=Armillaria novae-zelandiae TaxID=153914 RepID=A0AA39UNI1_9AGAR|nr:hypothetical protein IW261DRAFT_1559447 [Armillaria novae-zelandiae]